MYSQAKANTPTTLSPFVSNPDQTPRYVPVGEVILVDWNKKGDRGQVVAKVLDSDDGWYANRADFDAVGDDGPIDPYPADPRQPINPYDDRTVIDPYAKLIGELLGTQTVPQTGGPYIDHDTVLAVQKALLDSGYTVGNAGADGLWGKDTAAAVRLMQMAHSIPVTGVIDYGVLNALGIPAPKNAPTHTEAGVSGSAARQDVARTADNAAAEAAKADTPAAVQGAAAAVEVAASAAPPAPPEVQAVVKKAVAKAKAAKTPAEVADAAKDTKAAAALVSTAAVGWWGTPAWAGAPVKRWHAIVGGGVTLALSGSLIALIKGRK